MSLQFVFLILTYLITSSLAINRVNYEKKLREDLFILNRKDIDVNLRPVEYFNKTLAVNVGLVVNHVTDVNPKQGYAMFNCWVSFSWLDHSLKWNKYEYGGLTSLRIPPHLIWKPDIVLYNHAFANHADNYGQTLAILFNDGRVLWIPPTTIYTTCDFRDVGRFPYDEHACFFKFGSWTYDGFMIDIRLSTNNSGEVTRYKSSDHHEWKVISVNSSRSEKYYSCCEEPYPDVTFTLTLKRTSSFYTITLLIPAIFIMSFILVAFWLPPTANEKLVLNVFNLIYLIIILMQLQFVLRESCYHIPGIGLFCSVSLILAAIALIICTVTYNLSIKRHVTSPPDFVMKLLNGRLGCLFCLSHVKESLESNLLTSHEAHDNMEIPEGEFERNPHDDWISFAMALDRSFFYFYSLIFIILLSYCFS